MTNQLNLHGEKVVKQDTLILKYEGTSFENGMELSSFTKQISSVEKLLQKSIDLLHESNKIKDTSKDSKYFLELRKGSFETFLVVCLSNPITINVVSNFIVEYVKYLASKNTSKQYSPEIVKFSKDKNIRKFTRDILNPCLSNNDRVTFINGDIHNNFVIDSEIKQKVEAQLNEIEKDIPIEKYEQEFFGQIRKVDAVKYQEDVSKSKLGFVIDNQNDAIESSVESELSEEELKKIMFSRIKISAIAYFKGDDLIKLLIKTYVLAPRKKLGEY